MLSVDRIVSNIAICYDEHERKIELPLSELPEQIREGDMLILCNGRYQIDKTATEQRRAQLNRLQRQVFGKKEDKK